MPKSVTKVKAKPERWTSLAEGGHVVAIVVGIEDYQPRKKADLPKVEYAKADADAFADALRGIYPEDRLNLSILRDSEATLTNLDYEIKMAIDSLAAEDLFIFYYAGHGFHGTGGNRITAWDTHPFNIEGTTLLLRSAFFDRLAESPCNRALAFVDACASDFAGVVKGRDVITDMSIEELKEFLASAAYCAMFRSCQPGQKSYSSPALKHGIWTHFLLQALTGAAEEALVADRFLTDTSLRDYLRQEVPRFITRHTEIKAHQVPSAFVTASNTFAIRQVPPRAIAIAPAGDLSKVKVKPTRDYLEGVEGGAVRSLDRFDKKHHFIPTTVNPHASCFIRTLLAEKIDEEIQELYEATKTVFGLRRKGVSQESGDGEGNLDTDFFRYSVTCHQHRMDPADYVIIRRLEFREGAEPRQDAIDEVFGRIFDKVVVEIDASDMDFEELVEFFEDVEEAHGGELKDEKRLNRLTYTAPDGTRVRIDIERGRISLSGGGRHECSTLLARARRYRFDLTGPSRLLLT